MDFALLWSQVESFSTAAIEMVPMSKSDPCQLNQIAEHHQLDPLIWQNLVNQAKQRHCPSGEIIFDEGDFNPYLYLLLEGQVDLAMKVAGRGMVKILSLGSGDLIAWSAMLSSGLSAGRMTCRATCMTSCRLIYWSRDYLEHVCREHPEFGYHWMRFIATALANRLTATRLQLLDLFVGDVKDGFK
jgi:CRP/FNR family cyclic AMP-dependent transcriptional regulator